VVAHRAGNDLALLRRAEARGVGLVEADVRLWRGRLEVRHLKSAGPLPLLWDTWTVAPPWTPRLALDDLLDAAEPQTELMLDLKGSDMRLAHMVATALAARPRERISACSRTWPLLEPLRAVPGVRLVHSVGSTRQLRALLALRRPVEGISIHQKLLDPELTARLRARAGLLLSWPVSGHADAERLAGWGVDGLITEAFEALAVP
jgi:glycerophosphoryl diester phosphodiesterase